MAGKARGLENHPYCNHPWVVKISLFKLLLAITTFWALMPWLLWAVYQFHPPDHADPFWLLMIPFAFASFIPMILRSNDSGDTSWFPLGWVVASSLFNLLVGGLILLVVKVVRTKN
jgi:hypothetical protein